MAIWRGFQRPRPLVKGKIFTRLIKEITIAAKQGGGDVDSNPRLRTAVAAAKVENMPADNIKRAIQRGTGELPGRQTYEEITLEGYGPGGVAILVKVVTDNRNRTVSEIRHLFTKGGGNLSEAGSVAWIFRKKGSIFVPKAKANEDEMRNIVLEYGGEDLNEDDENWEITTDSTAYEGVLEAVKKAGIDVVHSEVGMVSQNYIKLEGPAASQMIRLLEAIEDHDDVQNVYSNFETEMVDITFTFDSSLSPDQVRSTLRALADYYRACGGVGFEIDTEFEDILVSELAYA